VPQSVDLYDSAYGNYGSDTYRQVRLETYGEDFGQTSWVTTEESKEIPRLLDLSLNSSVLEVGCGSGGYALHLAEKVGCRLVGLDLNAPGVRNANQLALARGLASTARFEQCDASKDLPFDDQVFDAVFSNDRSMPYSRPAPGVGRNVSRAEARRTDAVQRCFSSRWNAFQRRNRHPQLDRLLCVQSAWRE
jgi:SAM-dependent methyltransferase